MQKMQNEDTIFTMHIRFLRLLRSSSSLAANTLERIIFKIVICSLKNEHSHFLAESDDLLHVNPDS